MLSGEMSIEIFLVDISTLFVKGRRKYEILVNIPLKKMDQGT